MTFAHKSAFPQVLFLGNGLLRSFGGKSWDNLISTISKRDDLPSQLKCPFPLQAVLATNDHIQGATEHYAKEFWGNVNPQMQKQLQSLLSIQFNDILTTNYSYEIESAALGVKAVSKNYLIATCKNQEQGKKVEPKYLLQSCQEISYNGHNNRIWHIHGEARKPNSMILGHYYYASLLHRIMDYAEKTSRYYAYRQQNNKKQSYQSWIDSFLLGDVYILGFGMDFSELDIWWLLNRKKREVAAHGKVYFYEPGGNIFSEKEELLKLLDVEVVHCGVPVPEGTPEEKGAAYSEFYIKAIEDIGNRVAHKKSVNVQLRLPASAKGSPAGEQAIT